MVDPDDPARTWTLEEANAALGRVSETVARAMQATDQETLVDAAKALADEGVLLRDHRSGLIDFAARAASGRPYWLCWMWGEPEIDTWHWVEDGFAGRTPVAEVTSVTLGRTGTAVLASTAAVTTACVLPSFLLGAMAVQVRRDLDFDEAGIGIAFAMFFAAASVASAPLGRVTERRGPEPSLRIAACVSGASCLGAAAMAGSLGSLMPFIAVAGASNALCQPAANLLIARAVPTDRQGIAFAVKQSAIPAATLLAGLAVPTIALTVGWRWGFVVAAALAFGSALSVQPVASKEEGRHDAPAPRDRRRVRPDVPFRVMATLAVGIAFGAAAGGTLGSFLVSAAVDAGISEGNAGWLLTLGSLLGITVRLIAGVRADRRGGGHLRVVVLMLLTGAVAFAVLAAGEPWAYVIAGPAGFCTAWAWPGLFNLAVVRANPSSPAAATGITQTGTYIGAVSGPLLFGVIAGRSSYTAAWFVAVGFALLAAAAMAVGRSRLRSWRAATEPVPL